MSGALNMLKVDKFLNYLPLTFGCSIIANIHVTLTTFAIYCSLLTYGTLWLFHGAFISFLEAYKVLNIVKEKDWAALKDYGLDIFSKVADGVGSLTNQLNGVFGASKDDDSVKHDTDITAIAIGCDNSPFKTVILRTLDCYKGNFLSCLLFI